MRFPYEPPSIERLGSLHEMTREFNKVGRTPDQFTVGTGGTVIGSLVPAPPA